MQYPQWFLKGGRVPHQNAFQHFSNWCCVETRCRPFPVQSPIRFPELLIVPFFILFFLKLYIVFALGTIWFMSYRKTTFISVKGLMCALNVMTSLLRSWRCEFMFCVAGADSIKKYWSRYYQGSQGVVFVLDSASSEEDLEVARTELHSALQHPQLCTLPFLILANHQDKPAARSVQEVTRYMLNTSLPHPG